MTDLETQKKRPCYLLVKRGLYYAPDRQGYTAIKDQAGRYRKVDALGLDGVTAIHEDEAGDFSPACWPETKIGHLTRKIERLEAENAKLREALVKEYEENLWNAYSTGHVKNGLWSHLYMSDGERLARECGFDPTQYEYPDADIRAAIPRAARAALKG